MLFLDHIPGKYVKLVRLVHWPQGAPPLELILKSVRPSSRVPQLGPFDWDNRLTIPAQYAHLLIRDRPHRQAYGKVLSSLVFRADRPVPEQVRLGRLNSVPNSVMSRDKPSGFSYGGGQQLVGKLQERYGYAKEEAEREADEFAKQV